MQLAHSKKNDDWRAVNLFSCLQFCQKTSAPVSVGGTGNLPQKVVEGGVRNNVAHPQFHNYEFG